MEQNTFPKQGPGLGLQVRRNTNWSNKSRERVVAVEGERKESWLPERKRSAYEPLYTLTTDCPTET